MAAVACHLGWSTLLPEVAERGAAFTARPAIISMSCWRPSRGSTAKFGKLRETNVRLGGQLVNSTLVRSCDPASSRLKNGPDVDDKG